MTASWDELDDDAVAETVLRCQARIARLVNGMSGPPGGDPADFDAALAEFDRLPADLPMRGWLAAGLVAALMRSPTVAGMARMRRLGALLEIAEADPPPMPQWPQLQATAKALALMHAAADGGPFSPAASTAAIDALAATAGDNPGVHLLQQLTRIGTTLQRAAGDEDPSALREAAAGLAKLRAQTDADSPAAPLMETMAQAIDLFGAYQRGDQQAAGRLMDLYQEYADRPDADPLVHRAAKEGALMTGALRTFLDAGFDDPAARPTDEQIAAVRQMVDRPDATDAERAFYRTSAGMLSMAAGFERDPDRIDAAIAEFRAALAQAPPDDPQLVFHLGSLGMGLVARSELTGDLDALTEADQVLERARELAGGPTHPNWSLVSEGLAHVRRRRGEIPDARRIALEALRSHTWRVLLQSDIATATEAASKAAADALQLAHWCLRDAAPGDAVRALDAGRGLILFAATELRDVGSRLDDAGRGDLADRWRAATTSGRPEDAPGDLRREVLTVLVDGAEAGAAGPAALLDPPSLPEIRTALATLDADALVYLVPGKPPTFGAAVIVPVDGPPSYLALTSLMLDEEVDVERYLAVLSRRDAARDAELSRDLAVEPADEEFQQRLDTLCDWAWRAAIGPLVERYLASRPVPAERPHRVVLVPIGELARIPWQAARRADGVYAVELAAFSYAASARMLCDSAARASVGLTPVGLVVGDPDTGGRAVELPGARAEAFAIHRSFYPGARYIGRRPNRTESPSGRGCAGEVRGWLTSTHPGAGAMLHLACHGVIRSDPGDTSSFLLLADGERLTAEELVAMMAAHPGRAISLVVLAACRTGVSARGYDEAYSLGTAFLASGVRSVLSTQWSVPDDATSVLTFMFHHYLMAEGRPAWDALRRAQLWMLEADRQPVDVMPRRLRDQLAQTDPARVVAWAGFIHWGQ